MEIYWRGSDEVRSLRLLTVESTVYIYGLMYIQSCLTVRPRAPGQFSATCGTFTEGFHSSNNIWVKTLQNDNKNQTL